jgi:tyrosyl-tRNA synthetase
MGLQGMKQPEGFDSNKQIDIEISSKMSKSQPETCILVHDTKEEIKRKMNNAFCPPKVVDNNPVLEYAKYMIFRKFKTLEIKRPTKYGGDLEIGSYEELEKLYRQGKIHPLDLKNGVTEAVDKLIQPIRKHFEKSKKAKELLKIVKSAEVTR